MKWTLLWTPHLSGPNIIVYSVLSPKRTMSAPLLNSFKYPPPHSCPSWYLTSYLKSVFRTLPQRPTKTLPPRICRLQINLLNNQFVCLKVYRLRNNNPNCMMTGFWPSNQSIIIHHDSFWGKSDWPLSVILGERFFKTFFFGCRNFPRFADSRWVIQEIYEINCGSIERRFDKTSRFKLLYREYSSWKFKLITGPSAIDSGALSSSIFSLQKTRATNNKKQTPNSFLIWTL